MSDHLWPHPTVSEMAAELESINITVEQDLKQSAHSLSTATQNYRHLCGVMMNAMHNAIMQRDNAEAELAGLRADAMRYRFLRDFLDPKDYYSKWPRWTVAVESGGTGSVLRGEQLDSRIDTAIGEGAGT